MTIEETLLKIRKRIRENRLLYTLCVIFYAGMLVLSAFLMFTYHMALSIILLLLGAIVIIDLVYKFES